MHQGTKKTVTVATNVLTSDTDSTSDASSPSSSGASSSDASTSDSSTDVGEDPDSAEASSGEADVEESDGVDEDSIEEELNVEDADEQIEPQGKAEEDRVARHQAENSIFPCIFGICGDFLLVLVTFSAPPGFPPQAPPGGSAGAEPPEKVKDFCAT